MKNWICILRRDNFDVVKEKSVWGVSDHNKKVLRKTTPGDTCVFYLVSEGRGAIPFLSIITHKENYQIHFKGKTMIEICEEDLKVLVGQHEK